MCQIVRLIKSGIVCVTVQELIHAFPNLKLVKNEMYDKIIEDSCLCQIYLEDTFDYANIEWQKDWSGFILNNE